MSEIDDRLDRLESQLDNQQQRIDDQQATIEDQQDIIESQQATIEEQREQIADLQDDGGTAAAEVESTVLNRRNALKAGGLLALLFGSAGTASADSQGQVGTAEEPLRALYTERLVGGSETASDSAVELGGDLDVSGNALDNVASLDNGGSAISVDDTLDLGASGAVELNTTASTASNFGPPEGYLLFGMEDDDDTDVGLIYGQQGTGQYPDTDGGSELIIETWSDGDEEIKLRKRGLTKLRIDEIGDVRIEQDLKTQYGTTIWDESEGRIGAARVQSDSILSGAVGSSEIAENAVGETEINENGVGTSALDTTAVAGSSLTDDGGALAVDSTIEVDTVDFEGMEIRGIGSNALELAQTTGIDTGGSLIPATTGNIALGSTNSRWSDIYTFGDVNTSSDARLKRNVTDLSNGLERLRDIRPVSYEWKDEDDPDRKLGFVAQELDDAVPEAVEEPADEDGYLGVTYNTVLPVAVDAIQTQQEQIEDLEAENEHLRERVTAIEAELGIDAAAGQRGIADD